MITVAAPARLARRAARALAGARATTTYLFALAVTSFTLQGANPRLVYGLIVSASTNLHNMVREPAQVLIASAFWLQVGWPAWGLAAAGVLIMVPAERWLGTWRWIGVFAAGHVGATLITVTGVAMALHHGWLPSEEARATDVGMSYGVVALAGALTYRWSSRRHRLTWAATWLIGLAVAAGLGQTFTDYGHLCALLIGLGITPGFRPGSAVRSLLGRPTRSPTSRSCSPVRPGRPDEDVGLDQGTDRTVETRA